MAQSGTYLEDAGKAVVDGADWQNGVFLTWITNNLAYKSKLRVARLFSV